MFVSAVFAVALSSAFAAGFFARDDADVLLREVAVDLALGAAVVLATGAATDSSRDAVPTLELTSAVALVSEVAGVSVLGATLVCVFWVVVASVLAFSGTAVLVAITGSAGLLGTVFCLGF